ncbi:allophanate hydrolase [Telmatospirillum siberiense]|uniref:Allophanate hydrolase n=1 Tax=Telmatospirillum siberiense TaxID=382514 RepID=A0A2N3PPM9_9PROT|nr:allophanate hydrolase [Telmatospirillum siberiense]PKU22347.1 allophanate hydrolase [Telmatospirillum siberiense]
MTFSLDIARLSEAYRSDDLTPSGVVAEVFDRIAVSGDDGVWITLVDRGEALDRARALEAIPPAGRDARPLFGLPFSVKDCIDVEGLPTTAACPDFAYRPSVSSPVVERLRRAGAILIGKTNLDQFATGIVGTRSPYGIARNPFDPACIPGGSSAGAAVSVAAGLVSFAIGSDTGGSGRVPASFNNVVGVKPTRGLISLRGSVGTVRSLDCLSVFALTVADATLVRRVAEGFDEEDPWSRRPRPHLPLPTRFRMAVPRTRHLEFLGDDANRGLFHRALATLERLGGKVVEIDYAPFLELNELLFKGAFLAERAASCGPFVTEHSNRLHPETRAVLAGAAEVSGVQAFQCLHRLQWLRRQAEQSLDGTDLLVLPTTPTLWTITEMEEDPLGRNAALGRYTNFVNMLDLAAVAVPAGFRPGGRPAGITLAAPAFTDDALAELAERLQRALALPLGATGFPLS